MANSDDETGSTLGVSSPDTQFVPQENDDELLWEVLGITAEQGNNYRVRWAGIDPQTGKPWKQSWVHKHDCTDVLVRAWKVKQAKSRKIKDEKAAKKKASRGELSYSLKWF
jgi:hypothetical protein